MTSPMLADRMPAAETLANANRCLCARVVKIQRCWVAHWTATTEIKQVNGFWILQVWRRPIDSRVPAFANRLRRGRPARSPAARAGLTIYHRRKLMVEGMGKKTALTFELTR